MKKEENKALEDLLKEQLQYETAKGEAGDDDEVLYRYILASLSEGRASKHTFDLEEDVMQEIRLLELRKATTLDWTWIIATLAFGAMGGVIAFFYTAPETFQLIFKFLGAHVGMILFVLAVIAAIQVADKRLVRSRHYQ